jgi:hypothetical protein
MPPLPNRQIHLDFHTGPDIPDVAMDFDAQEFADAMRRAHVNSVTVFAKCHHGHSYYNTARPERHPGLAKGRNLLGEQIEALHRVGIRAPIYLSVQCDEFAARAYPDWVALDENGQPVKRPAGKDVAGWTILDMSSPYQDFLAEQLSEVLKFFSPVDGIFFDMCWDQISAGAGKDKNPHEVSITYMRRFFDQVKSASPDATVFFNVRKLEELPGDGPVFTHVEIEALPTGKWGYLYFPRHVRFIRTLGLPYLAMTSRFHKSWADFGGLKPYAALEYETSQAMAYGAGCSIGDQMHPRGTLDPAAYDRIAKVYHRIEDREPWLVDAKPVAQIGVVSPTNEAGVASMLGQLRHQFDFISPDADFGKYDLLILADAFPSRQRLESFLETGGALLATGTSGLNSDGTEVLLPALGIEVHGPSRYTATYIRFGPQIADGIPAMDHVMYNRGYRVTTKPGAEVLAQVVEPYFERSSGKFCSHFQTPPDRLTEFAAAVQRGRTAYIPWNIFADYAKHANLPCRWLVEKLLNRLLPDPLLRVEAPSTLEATVTRQANRWIVHLLHCVPQRRADGLDIVEDILPLRDVKISLKITEKPGKVYLAPSRTPLDFAYENGRVNVTIPIVTGHEMVVLESHQTR